VGFVEGVFVGFWVGLVGVEVGCAENFDVRIGVEVGCAEDFDVRIVVEVGCAEDFDVRTARFETVTDESA